MRTKRFAGLLTMWLVFCAGAMAQKNIEQVVADMEKNDNTRITSIKRRDPKTKKVVKVTKTLRLTDAKISKRALDAFEKDEENALNSIKEKRARIEYTLKFQEKKETRTYILTIRDGNDVEISVFITPVGEGNTSWLETDWELSGYAGIDKDFDVNMEHLNQELKKKLDGLGEKIQRETRLKLKKEGITVD